jgi:PAS domain S-box-containing protein
MRESWARSIEGRLTIVLALGFAVVIATAGALFYVAAASDDRAAWKSELSSIATVIAASEASGDPEGLQRVARSLAVNDPTIRSVRLIRIREAELDPGLRMAAREAVAIGRAVTVSRQESPLLGSDLVCLAPLPESADHVVAVQRSQAQFRALLQDLQWRTGLGCVVMILLAGAMAYLLATRLARTLAGLGDSRCSLLKRGIIRTSILEFSLYAVASVALVAGGWSFLGQINARQDYQSSLVRSRSLTDAAVRAEQDDLAGAISSLRPTDRKVAVSGELGTGMGFLEWVQREHRAETDRRDRLRARMDDNYRALGVALIVAGLLSISALAFLRVALSHELGLREAIAESERHQQAYQGVAENLPIGFFTYRSGRIDYSNPTWNAWLGHAPNEGGELRWLEAVVAEDRPHVESALEAAAQGANDFSVDFRIQAGDGGTRHLSARGVPFGTEGGRPEAVLGFLLDVTDEVAARQGLEHKHREAVDAYIELERALQQIETNFEAMVFALVKAVEMKDPYTAGHSERVMMISASIAEELRLDANDIRILRLGALVHDVGKIGIPDDVLTKPSRLTNEEYELVKRHTVMGARMVEGIPAFAPCVPIVRSHHERLDGSGYPDRLTEHEISILVRIVAVADSYDAMTSNRAYRAGMDPARAIEELVKEADMGKLDSKIVAILSNILEKQPNWSSGTFSQAA